MQTYLSAQDCTGQQYSLSPLYWGAQLSIMRFSCCPFALCRKTCLCCAAAVASKSKHALVKEAWEFLHSEGHINQGILSGEPPVSKSGTVISHYSDIRHKDALVVRTTKLGTNHCISTATVLLSRNNLVTGQSFWEQPQVTGYCMHLLPADYLQCIASMR